MNRNFFKNEDVKWIESNINSFWNTNSVNNSKNNPTCKLEIKVDTSKVKQIIDGFGGCFNEMGWEALSILSASEIKNILKDLFDKDGCDFNYGRLPMGASDFGLDWFSYNEVENDFEMKNFSIERDCKNLIPYINLAKKYQSDLKLWSSPWSPPTWMKKNKNYAGKASENNFLEPEKYAVEMNDAFIMEDKYLKAYAKYFVEYIKAYDRQNLKIVAVHPQNEPNSSQVFPSCVWTPKSLAKFTLEYLAPALKGENLDTEVWIGTIERGQKDRVDQMLNYTSSDNSNWIAISDKISCNIFNNIELHEPVVETKLVSSVDNEFLAKINNFSVRYCGDFQCTKSHAYDFTIKSKGYFKLYIDDKLVLDYWDNKTKNGSCQNFIEEGTHKFVIEYKQLESDGEIKFTINPWTPELAEKYISGIGFQWAGKNAIPTISRKYPKYKLMQTETECGDGSNDWNAAVKTFRLIKHYFDNGVNSYMYWNMILDDSCASAWGWLQNSMISIDRATNKAIYNPEFYLMKHFSYFVKEGYHYIDCDNQDTLIFRKNEKIIICYFNECNEPVSFNIDGQTLNIEFENQSFNTFEITLY